MELKLRVAAAGGSLKVNTSHTVTLWILIVLARGRTVGAKVLDVIASGRMLTMLHLNFFWYQEKF